MQLGARVPRWNERLFTFLALLFSTGLLVSQFLRQGASYDPTSGDGLIQALWIVVYLVTFFLLLKKLGLRSSLQRNVMIWLLLALVVASVTWSVNPEVSLRKSLALVGTTMLGVYLGGRYTRDELIGFLAWAFGIAALVSLGMGLLFPEVGVVHELRASAWRGAFFTKNELGRIMALGAVTWFVYFLNNHRRRILSFLFFLLCVGLLILSTSQNALLVFLMLMLVIPLGSVLRLQLSLRLPLVTSILAVIVWAVARVFSNAELILDGLGRDLTLTGRTALWETVLAVGLKRPLLGYGYGGFWLGWQGPSSLVWLYNPWEPPHSHNGYLDLWLHLGLLGVLLFVFAFAKTMVHTLRLIRHDRHVSAVYPLVLLAFILAYNIAESNLVNSNSLSWILFVAISHQTSTREQLRTYDTRQLLGRPYLSNANSSY